MKESPSKNWIYPDLRMDIGTDSPIQIFIPSKALMFKLMRSCINIKNKNDLWINQLPFFANNLK